MAAERFCIVVSEHRRFGTIATPYIVDYTNAPTYRLVEQVSTENAKSHSSVINDKELEIAQRLNSITEQSLCHKFSKNKSVRDFVEKIEEKTIDEFIIPYINKVIYSTLGDIIANRILIFQRISGVSTLHERDIVSFCKSEIRPKCFFTLDDKNDLRYSLTISEFGNEGIGEIKLTGRKVTELTRNPASLIIDHKLYVFNNIESKRFMPFVSKHYILVQSQSVDKYMRSFVKNCIRDYYVNVRGFAIKKQELDCSASLKFEEDILGYCLRLQFQYGDEKYTYGDKKKSVNIVQENDAYVFYTTNRNFSKENRYANLLENNGLQNFGDGRFGIAGNSTEEKYNIAEWCERNCELLKSESIDLEMSSNFNFYNGSVDLQLDISDNIDWFDFHIIVDLDGYKIPFTKFRENILSRNREYELPNGQIFILPEEWFATWTDIFTFGKSNANGIKLDKIHMSILPQTITGTNDYGNDVQKISTTERHGELNATLRPYQEEGFRWLCTLFEQNRGGILADDMGLGKTIQTIAMLSHAYAVAPDSDDKEADLFSSFNCSTLGASLIVVPTSIIHNWAKEITKFAPHLKIYNYAGRNRVKTSEIGKILRHYHVVLITYGLLRNDIDFLRNYKFGYLILDESQNIKNPSSLTYKSVCQIDAEHKLTISGTPIENSLNDLWAQMNIVNKGLLGNATFFRSYFAAPIENDQNEEKKQKLKQMIAPYILRRTKDMVAKDLPPISEQTIYCEMTDAQQDIYEREVSGCRNELFKMTQNNKNLDKFVALKALTRLRLIANHPRLAIPEYEGDSGKTSQICELVRNIASENHKMLIFSSFVRDLDLLKNEIRNMCIEYCMLTGHTANREQVIGEFQSDPNKKVFLISLKAGGVGLNLTEADYVLMLNPWWNPQAEKQAIDRAHRIGQTKHVFVYRFITSGSIEEKIAHLQEKKLQIADAFITSGNSIGELSAEEIAKLII